MRNSHVWINLLLGLVMVSVVQGQPFSSNFSVIENGDTLRFAWTGGMENPRFANIDLNQDGKQDLIILDRADSRILPFVHVGNVGETRFRFAPEYIEAFPDTIYHWFFLADYNCDGEPDLFCATEYSGYVRAYKNTRLLTGQLGFALDEDTLKAWGLLGPPYYLSTNDIPGIADVDFDGDIDFLVIDVLGTRVEFYRNEASICGQFDLRLHSMCWGHFNEVSGFYAGATLGDTCFNEQKTLHQGGMLLALNLNGDTLMDLMFSDEGPTNAVALYNGGSRRIAHITSEDTLFPSYNQPINLHYFPALFFADVNADNQKDLLASPNGYSIPQTNTFTLNSGSMVHFYQNLQSTQNPLFALQSQDFLISEMIDAGTGSFPLFFDEDMDGDLDLLLYTQQKTFFLSGQWRSRKEWRFYKNIQNNNNPVFELQTTNYQGFNQWTLLDTLSMCYAAMTDIDADGDSDLFLTNIENNRANIIFLERTTTGFQYVTSQYGGNLGLDKLVSLHFADVDGDGDKDMFAGNIFGKIDYVENTGNASNASWATPILNWGGIDLSGPYQPTNVPRPWWFDFDLNGTPNLLLGSDNDKIQVYEYLGNGQVQYLGDLFGKRLGRSLNPVVLRFNAQDSLSFFIGNRKGGIMLFRTDIGTVTRPKQPVNLIAKIFPNPFDNFLEVHTNWEGGTYWRIFDLRGKLLAEGNELNRHFVINIDNLSEELYFLQLISPNGHSIQQKIIHKKL